VRVGILKDDCLTPENRVVLVLQEGFINKIRLPANNFFAVNYQRISSLLLEATPRSQYIQLGRHIKAETQVDHFGTWLVLRSYYNGHVMDRLYISVATWIQFQRLVPVPSSASEEYINIVMDGGLESMIPLSDLSSSSEEEESSTNSGVW
jgi:hypothetical protein